MSERIIALDAQTTGLLVEQDHRIIEIGAVELINQRPTGVVIDQRLNPERDIEPGAAAVHDISCEQLTDKPRFTDIAEQLLDFINGATLIIHNAPFYTGFIDAELQRLGPSWGELRDYCTVICTRALAKSKLPGIKHSLSNLCEHYYIDHSASTSALSHAQLLSQLWPKLSSERAAPSSTKLWPNL